MEESNFRIIIWGISNYGINDNWRVAIKMTHERGVSPMCFSCGAWLPSWNHPHTLVHCLLQPIKNYLDSK